MRDTAAAAERRPGTPTLVRALVVLPVVLALCFAFLDPRPYYLAGNDPEHDYYYGARLVAAGHPVYSTHHPGTPIYYLGALLLRAVGTDLAHTQRFLNLGYVVAATLTTLSLWLFARLLAPYYRPGVLALALAAAVVWPSFLLHLNHFGSEAFLVAFGLVPIALLWRQLHEGAPRPALLALAGLATGLCLASKMVFVPLAIAMLVASVVHLARLARARRAPWTALLVYPLATSAGFLLLVLPIVDRLVGVLYLTIKRPEIRVAKAPAALARDLGELVARIATVDAPLLLLAAACVATLLGALWRPRRPHLAAEAPDGPVEPPFDALAGGTFVALLGLALVYTLLVSVEMPPQFLGFQLRNSTPYALVIPLLVLYTSRVARDARPLRLEGWPPRACAAVAAAIVVHAVGTHAVQRHRTTRQMAAQRRGALEAILEQRPAGGGRIAFWDGSPGLSGPLSFHYWGNARYAGEMFTDDVLRAFPDWVPLRLRDYCNEVMPPQARVYAGQGTESRYGAIGRWFWGTVMDRGPYKRQADGAALVADAAAGEPVSLVAVPLAEWRLECWGKPVAELVASSRPVIGDGHVEERRIGGETWILLRADRPPRPPSPSHAAARRALTPVRLGGEAGATTSSPRR